MSVQVCWNFDRTELLHFTFLFIQRGHFCYIESCFQILLFRVSTTIVALHNRKALDVVFYKLQSFSRELVVWFMAPTLIFWNEAVIFRSGGKSTKNSVVGYERIHNMDKKQSLHTLFSLPPLMKKYACDTRRALCDCDFLCLGSKDLICQFKNPSSSCNPPIPSKFGRFFLAVAQ